MKSCWTSQPFKPCSAALIACWVSKQSSSASKKQKETGQNFKIKDNIRKRPLSDPDEHTHSVPGPQQWLIPAAQFIQQRKRKFLTPRPQLPCENMITHTSIQSCALCSLINKSSFTITSKNSANIQDYPSETEAYF